MLPALIHSLTLEELIERANQGRLRGVFRVSNADYHAGPGVSSTNAKLLLKSPAHQRYAEREEKDSFRVGSAIHAAMLEPELYATTYVIWPGERRGNRYEECAAKAAAAGHTVLTIKEADIVDAAVERFKASKAWSHFCRGAEFEIAAYARDPETGVLMKSKLDVINEDLEIGDIKSTGLCVADPGAWMKEVLNRGYHISAAMYLDVWGLALSYAMSSFIWIVIEKTHPFGLRFFVCPSEYLRIGRIEYQRALKVHQKCTVENEWPCYPDEFTELPPLPFYITERYA